MGDKLLTFAEWIPFEAERIVGLGLMAAEDQRADWMRIQIEAALRKAGAHFQNGLTETDPPARDQSIRTVTKSTIETTGRCVMTAIGGVSRPFPCPTSTPAWHVHLMPARMLQDPTPVSS